MKWSFEEILRDMRGWAASKANRDFMFDRSKARLLASCQQAKSLRSGADVATSLEHIGNWISTIGAIEVMDGNLAGWGLIQSGSSCGAWKVRILIDVFHMDSNRNKQPRVSDVEIALAAAHCWAVGRDAAGESIAQLLNSHDDRRPFTSSADSPLPALVCALHERGVSGGSAQLGPYAKAVRALSTRDVRELSGGLADASAFHLLRWSDEQTAFAEFQEYPFPLFPVEIAAVVRRARDMGLEVALPDHPLLRSPLAMPDPPPDPVDPDYVRAVEAWWV